MNKRNASIAIVVSALVALSGYAPAKTLLQDQIQYGRLSPELLDSDPLFEVVAAGLPTGDFVALLSTRDRACLLEIVSGRDNKIVLTFTDHITCARDFEFEDAYAMGHAHQFRDFLNANFKSLKEILTRYKIDFSKFPDAVEIGKRDGNENGRQCVKLARLQVCKGKNLDVSLDRID